MATFHFDLVSPEKLAFSGEVDQVDVPGLEGDFGVLAGHAPVVAAIRPGILTVTRARKIQRFLSQPNFVAEQFTGTPGEYVKVEDTIKGFGEILEGKHDELPEQAFYMVGTIEQAIERGRSAEKTAA